MPETPVVDAPVAEFSLMELIDKGGFEASLITTFNSHLPFYEEIILPRLQRRNCRRNFVLMDAGQCAGAWQAEASRPRYAGVEYTLVPMHSEGAFHPKIILLLGHKKAAVSVGSHNLTLSGFGVNRELTNLLEPQDNVEDGAELLHSVWSATSDWLQRQYSSVPPLIIDSALELARLLPAAPKKPSSGSVPMFLAQADHTSSLFVKLRKNIPFQPRRIVVVGAFFDHELAFLKQLRETWPEAKLKVGVDPDTVFLPAAPEDPDLLVDAAQALGSSVHHYLHAKALYLEGEHDEDAALCTGSANPSAQGWGLKDTPVNAEAVILVHGQEARIAANATGIIRLFDLPRMGSDQIDLVTSRTKLQQNNPNEPGERLLVGVATDHESKIDIDLSLIKADLVCDRYSSAAWHCDVDGDGTAGLPEPISIARQDEILTVGFSEPPVAIRSLRLLLDEFPVARVLVHHPTSVSKHSNSSAQRQIRDSLASIDSDPTSLSHLIEIVSKVIFSGDAEDQLYENENRVRSASSKTTKLNSEDAKPRPDSLEVDAPSSSRKKKSQHMLSQGDLADLIDALIHKLYVPPMVTIEQKADGTGGPEDGNGGNNPPLVLVGDVEHKLSDEDISKVVLGKVTTLANRITKREKGVALDVAQTKSQVNAVRVSAAVKALVMQLTAVVALLRELRRVENNARWSSKGLKLVGMSSLKMIFEESMRYLFDKEHDLIVRAQSGNERYIEVEELYLLLTWLAWTLGYDFKAPLEPRWKLGPEQHGFRVRGNGYLTRLMPLLAEAETANQLWTGMENTLPRSAIAKSEAQMWLSRNIQHGERVLDVLTSPIAYSMDSKRDLVEGDLAWMPGLDDRLVVVTDIGLASLKLWDFDQERGYKQSFVRTFIP
jgi:hypothetical protein